MYPHQKTHRRRPWRLIVTALIVVAGTLVALGWTSASHKDPATAKTTAAQNSTGNQTTQASDGRSQPVATFDKQARSLSDPASIWVIVNKKHQLQPKDYTPAGLVAPDIPLRLSETTSEMLMRPDAAKALETMAAAAKKSGAMLMVASAYRSYQFQVDLYNRYVQEQGQEVADTQSARPGYSEHQTGLAVDLEPANGQCEVDACFAGTAEGKWLAANAYKYGFIIRYGDGLDRTTGYIYEPWHVRYVGTDLSNQLAKTGTATLEAFFKLGDAGRY